MKNTIKIFLALIAVGISSVVFSQTKQDTMKVYEDLLDTILINIPLDTEIVEFSIIGREFPLKDKMIHILKNSYHLDALFSGGYNYLGTNNKISDQHKEGVSIKIDLNNSTAKIEWISKMVSYDTGEIYEGICDIPKKSWNFSDYKKVTMCN